MTPTVTAEPQHMTALAHANRHRIHRANLRRQINEGKLTVPQVLAEVPEYVETMTVYDLLRCQLRWGHIRTAGFLSRVGLREGKAVGSLTDRQRDLLAYEVAR